MRGHVRKRGNTWSIVVDIGRDPTKKNGRRQKWIGGFARKKDAEQELARMLERLNAGAYVEPTRQTVADFLEDWLAAQRARLRPSTLESYSSVLRAYVIPELGPLPLARLTTAHIDKLYADLLDSGRARAREDGPAGLSPRTVRYVHTILRRALGDAVRKQVLTRNPTDAADPPTPSQAKAPTMRTWSAAELRAFLAHVADDRLFAAWRLAATTGMRRGEVLGLRWRSVDLDAGRVRVTETLIEGAGAPRWSKPKSGRGRSIALDAETVEALRSHRKAQLEERMALGPAWQDHDLVFCREDGTPIWPRSFSRAFASHVKAAGLPSIRVHDLRHTWATLALAGGVHPKVVQERLGHATVSITLDVYSHAVPPMQEDAAERVASLFA